MARQLRIRIYPDGRIEAETQGVKGKKCTDYIRVLEELLDAETMESAYTAEYSQQEEVGVRQDAQTPAQVRNQA
jgi:hypothetical protein